MPQIYRAMTDDGGKPQIVNTARGLGARIGNGPNFDLPMTRDGNVTPTSGGMSVSPSWRSLPEHRIPRRLRSVVPGASGKDQDACWRMGSGPFSEGEIDSDLTLRLDTSIHGLVEPRVQMPSVQYLQCLAATRDLWEIDEE